MVSSAQAPVRDQSEVGVVLSREMRESLTSCSWEALNQLPQQPLRDPSPLLPASSGLLFSARAGGGL